MRKEKEYKILKGKDKMLKRREKVRKAENKCRKRRIKQEKSGKLEKGTNKM